MSTLSPVARFERILLSTDGSEHSSGAVDVAIEAAAKCSSHLTAFTMVISNPEVEAIAPQLVAKRELEARRILDEVEQRATASGVKIERLIRHGQDPARQIVGQAQKNKSDLIVMGRRGIRGLARMLVGEATVKVCAQAPCSVLVVQPGGRLARRSILVATDGSRYSDYAAVTADRLARLCSLPVTVLSVVVPGHNDARRAEASIAVERVRDVLIADGIKAESLVVEAPRPEIGVVETARSRGADLIVVGTHGRTALLDKVLIGSVSERIMGEADCPVMVVRSG